MQVNPQEVSAEEAITPRYDTIVIRGAKGQAVPKEVDGGEVVAWARGHELAAKDALEELVDDLAAGNCSYPAELTLRAKVAMELMQRRRDKGWEDEEKPAGGWTTQKPTMAGAYWIRGFRLFEADPGLPALVDVRLDGSDLVTNIHMSNSEDSLRQWSLVCDVSEKFEWLGPLLPAKSGEVPHD